MPLMFIGSNLDPSSTVRFHASWCKTCQKFGMQYERIGREIGDAVAVSDDGSEIIVREGEIRLAEIEYGANQDLCKSLGVRKLPSVHIYSGGKLVEPVACGPKRIGMLLSKISHYKSLSLPELSFEADMNQGLALGETVLETLCADNEVSDSPSCLTLV